jgi:prefoldin subunit 5
MDMDGTVQSLQEQIEKVEGQIERVEGEIKRVEGEIERVEGEIEELKRQMNELRSKIQEVRQTNLDLCKELLDRLKEFQSEKSSKKNNKNKLLDEKNKLWDKKDILWDEKDVFQKKIIAKQKLPNVPSSGKYLSSCAERHIWRPVHVQPWDVIGDIEDFVKIADTEKHVISIFPQHFRQEFKEGDEVFVTWCLMMEIQLFMAQKYPQIDFTFNKEVALAVSSSLSGCHKKDFLPNFYARDPQADFVMSVGSKNLLVFDVKGGGLGTDGLEGWPLHKDWACSCNSGFIWPPISSWICTSLQYVARMLKC